MEIFILEENLFSTWLETKFYTKVTTQIGSSSQKLAQLIVYDFDSSQSEGNYNGYINM